MKATSTSLPRAVGRFLDGLRTGDWDGMEQHLTPAAHYDASVPAWRSQYQGPSRIVQEFREEWTGRHPWRVVEQHITGDKDTVVVELELRGAIAGVDRHAADEEVCRLVNVFVLDAGRIAEHRVYCCGEWNADTLRRIEREAPKIERALHGAQKEGT